MDIGQTLLLFSIEAVIFICILTFCLYFAAKQHRGQLKEVINQLNQSKLFKAENETEQKRSKALLNKLKEKLSRLQRQITMLERFEQKYYRLKDKYDHDIGELKSQLAKASATDPEEQSNKKYAIKAGTTVDQQGGVDPSYLSYLAKKDDINDANEYTNRVSHEAKILNKKIHEQSDLIQSLQQDLRNTNIASGVEGTDADGKETAGSALHKLEGFLTESQNNSRELESSLVKLKKELAAANDKVAMMEMKLVGAGENNRDSTKPGPIIRAKYNELHQSEGMAAVDLDMEVALKDYEKIKQEVGMLRNNTSQQRQLIFTLEKEILELRNTLEDSSLSEEQQQQREAQIKRLENVLRETEGCVEVLESEVSYLQEKLVNYGKDDQLSSMQEIYDKTNLKLQRAKNMLERAAQIRAILNEIISLGKFSDAKHALEKLSAGLIDVFDSLDVSVYLRIETPLGELESSNSGNFTREQVGLLANSIRNNPDTAFETDDGFITSTSRIGTFVKALLTAENSLGKLRDSIQFILSVSDAVIVSLEEKQLSHMRQSALRHLVETVRKKISNLSIQNRYQNEEAQNIFNGLINELNATLATMSMSDTQSEFFTQMIDETKQRMSLLLENEVVVDQSLTALLDRIEHGTANLGKQ